MKRNGKRILAGIMAAMLMISDAPIAFAQTIEQDIAAGNELVKAVSASDVESTEFEGTVVDETGAVDESEAADATEENDEGEAVQEEIIESVSGNTFDAQNDEIIDETRYADANGFTWNGTIITGYSGTATDLVIPAEATEIGSKAFKGNTTIKSISFAGTNLKKIGTDAFSGTVIESISLPEGLETMEAYLFKNNTALKSITIPSSVKTMYSNNGGNHGALYSSAIETVVFEAGMTKIPDYATHGAASLKSVTIPSGVTEIGKSAFSGCTSLESISLPSGLKTIRTDAFSGTAISSITLPEGLETMEAYLFKNNTVLKSITIPSSVTTMYSNNGGNHGALYSSAIETVVFEAGIKAIPELAVQGATKLTSVTIPSGVTVIDDYAFSGCTSLENITLPEGLKTIGAEAFKGTAIETISLPEGLETMETRLFADNTVLKSITIPKTVTKMHSAVVSTRGALSSSAIETVVFENGIEIIPYMALEGATKLTSVTIPSGVTMIDDYAFSGCTSLENITLPEGLKTIGAEAFKGTAIETISLPEGLETMEARLFKDNTVLKSITIPKSVTKMSSSIVSTCGALNSSAIETVLFEAGMTKIPDYAMEGASKLTSAYISSSVTSIGNKAMPGNADFTIYSYTGAYALKYAKENNIAYVDLGPEEFEIVYELNGGIQNVGNPESYFSNSKKITLLKPTKTGYTFKGWYTKPDFASSSKITEIKSGSRKKLYLYAKWSANTYTVKYNANGGSGSIKSQKVTYDTEFTLNANKFTRKGYTFEGWATSKSGEVVYTDGAVLENLTAKSGATYTLYAVWKPITYHINYELNAEGDETAMNAEENPATFTVANEVKLAKPTRKGYTFGGWYTKDSLKSKYKVSKISKGTAKDVTLYAKWTKTKYTITYKLDGGKNDSTNAKSYYVDSEIITLNAPTKKGYEFAGWYTSKEFEEDTKVTSINPYDTVSNVTLYAKWNIITYTIDYVLDEGENNAKNKTEYNVNTKTFKLYNPTKEGYTFKGWYTDPEFKKSSKVTEIKKGKTGNITLYAKWAAK